MKLPKHLTSMTLMRKLKRTEGVCENFTAILEQPAGKRVLARRILPEFLSDSTLGPFIKKRLRELQDLQHVQLRTCLSPVTEGDDCYAIEEWQDGLSLKDVIAWSQRHNSALPLDVFLHIATGMCGVLDALHQSSVVHLGLRPEAFVFSGQGKLTLGRYALTTSPALMPGQGNSGAYPAHFEYLSPEQTQQIENPTASSDVFGLGAILFELAVATPLFKRETHLKTIRAIRKIFI